jgi:hypothetical protein
MPRPGKALCRARAATTPSTKAKMVDPKVQTMVLPVIFQNRGFDRMRGKFSPPLKIHSEERAGVS